MNHFNQIRMAAFEDELQKLSFDLQPDKQKEKPMKPRPRILEFPVVRHRDDAGEQGGAISSNGSPMSTGGL